jgi:exopolysaccharide biosynthesis polyprenyl glycosylphosphotransferase
MARAIVRLFPFEMAMLGLIEFSLLFALIFAMLSDGGAALFLSSNDLPRDCLILAVMLAVTIAGTAATIGLYRPEVCLDRRRFLLAGTIAALLAFPAILLVGGAYRMSLSGDHIAWLAGLVAIWLTFVLVIRFTLSEVAARMPVTRRVLIVGSGPRAALLRGRLAARRHGLFEATAPGMMPATDTRVWGIVIAEDALTPGAHDRFLDNKLRGVVVYSDVAFQEQHLGRIELDAIDARWLLTADGFRNGGISRAGKRVFDIVVGLVLTIVTLPLILVTAALIKLDSPGPVFYRQERTGLHGGTFTLFKFRSMSADAEAGGKPQWAQKRDPRITRVGAFIRASRIDELPQLFNVLRGEMSMIGPRPERPMFVEELGKAIPFYNCRSYVKPGLTGWAQVNYPYGASVEDAREKLAYDLYYVKNRGMLLDMLILLATVRVILFREGAR